MTVEMNEEMMKKKSTTIEKICRVFVISRFFSDKLEKCLTTPRFEFSYESVLQTTPRSSIVDVT